MKLWVVFLNIFAYPLIGYQSYQLDCLVKSMMFGTAGFTAVLTILKIIKDKNFDRKKPILIIGGTTGVGLICSIILKHLKYKTIISVRNSNEKILLKK